MEFAYRFRPVSRLLNEDGLSGELDGQYIYFASPDQLNDPLEGYKDVFFRGDRIIWENLIKHYIRCLINEVSLFLIRGPGQAPNRNIGVFASAGQSTEQLNSLNDLTYSRFISEPLIDSYVRCLAIDRKMRRWELVSHLSVLHPFALEEAFLAFYEKGLYQDKIEYFSNSRPERLANIKNFVTAMSETADKFNVYDELFKSVYSISEQYKLLTRLNVPDHSAREPWFHLLFEFPECYCESLEKLVYPSWYTACFMSSCADSSIWGTYGGNHKDVCLKFKVNQEKDHSSLELRAPTGCGHDGIFYSMTKMKLHDISYEKDFVEIDFFRSLGHLPMPQLMKTWYLASDGARSDCAKEILEDEDSWRDQYWKNFYHAITVKLKAWDREKESRLILSSNINDLTPSETRKLKYKFDSLEGIIFGINTSTEDKIKIIKRVRALCVEFKREHFTFYQAHYDQDLRSIGYSPLKAIKAGFTAE